MQGVGYGLDVFDEVFGAREGEGIVHSGGRGVDVGVRGAVEVSGVVWGA